MPIRALIFDLDGTAIPSQVDGMPSAKIIEAVKKAKTFCHVAIATGRPYELTENIVKALEIEDFCILNGGAHIYSLKNSDYVHAQEVDRETLTKLVEQLQDLADYEIADSRNLNRVKLSDYKAPESAPLACVFSTNESVAQKIIGLAQSNPLLTAHRVSSWQAGTFDVHITHKLATKKHAMQKLLELLQAEPSQVMVVGDGGNDLPLFELAGIKVAMGNADPLLKAEADWIAPSIDEDGLAAAIEKFIFPA